MEIETKVISRVTMKPSSPTPKSLQKHLLSFPDQISPQVYSSFVYFYASNPKLPNSEISNHLKRSLPDLLSRFYPLAGRLVENRYIDCNDGGVPFLDAEADCHISRVASDPIPKEMKRFLPYKTDEHQDFCMAVQATHFRCGGLAVAVLLSHKLFDALSCISFINAWFSAVRDGGEAGSGAPPPKFDVAHYFPPLDVLASQTAASTAEEEEEEEEVVGSCKFFRFSAATISALQEMYSSGGRRAGRVEAVGAFIWTRFMSTAGLRSDPDKICTVRTVVNLRTRVDPPLSEDHFGNVVGGAVARPAAGDGGVEFVQKVREAVKAVDSGRVAGMKTSEKQLEEMMAHAIVEELFCFTFTSLCGFPLYKVDFGSGRPVRVGFGPFFPRNVAIFMDTDSGGGIDALIHLTKKHMDLFEIHFNLQMLKSNL